MIDRRKTNPQLILNWFGGGIAVGLILVMGFVTYALVYEEVPETNQNALLILIGILSTNITSVIQYFFGSSAQTKQQSETIDTLAKTAQTAGTALASTGKPEAIVIPEGGSATATATPDGTVITSDVPKP